VDAAVEPIAIDLPAPGGADGVDAEKASELARRVNQRAEIWGADVQAAEELLSRHPSDPAMRKLAAAVLYAAAGQERGRRRFVQAMAYLDRATVIDPANTRVWHGLMVVAQEAGDWPRSEAAARSALAVDAGLAEAWYGLGYALMRQDRNPEAVEALRTAVGIRADPNTQALLDRVLAGMANEKGMTEQQLARFHVRYDGEEHETVGREILRGLERHYATLTSALDFEPPTAIPVILHSRQTYHRAGGVTQALGHFDGIDGRIQVPIQGFAGLSADLDNTLLHELTHAFVHGRTRGVAQRFPMQEGLAQYMSGDRVDSRLTAEQVGWLADGRIGGDQGAYLEALSFVEYLVGTRGMGGMNDLLKAMAETGSQDEAFKQVHGQTLTAMQKAWRQRLRQQHGS
jgi:tetratricopeptide (TPR) repeat protein